jgi:hypothetical protein
LIGADLEIAQYRLNRLARGFDYQTSVTTIEEKYDGEFYRITFLRGHHTYVHEVDGPVFQEWMDDEEPSNDMIHMVKVAIDELEN